MTAGNTIYVFQNRFGTSGVWDENLFAAPIELTGELFKGVEVADIDALTAGSHCYSIGDQLPYCTDPSDLSCSMLALTLRGYLFPGTQRGAASASALNPQVIPLQKPGPE